MTTKTYAARPHAAHPDVTAQPVTVARVTVARVTVARVMSTVRIRSIDAVTGGSHATGLSLADAAMGAFGTRDDAKGLPPRGAPV